MYQFFKEKEPSAGHNSGSQEAYASLNVSKRKVESCGTAKTRCQSVKIMNDDKSGSPRLRVTVHAVTQSSPSAVLSFIESVPQGAHITHITVDDSDKRSHSEPSGPSSSNVLRDVHIVRTQELYFFLDFFNIIILQCNVTYLVFIMSGQLTEDFLELAKDNTDKDLETCGVLGAFLV
ncbi:hypothetical protein Pint_22972 [Pistacia integerrima]|uniref:Uncharacterized protein n=1 Tax=Pistacia integerrima TaxID=434235 RepID=A0ACC0YMX7_9ROSI|nr:hypothetical protein Pint_22972 [Pistacia integerrima]